MLKHLIIKSKTFQYDTLKGSPRNIIMKTSKRLSQSASAPVAESTSHLLNYRLKQIELAKKRSINGMKLAQSNKIKRAQGLVKKPRSKSQKAGLILPVTRFLKKFKAMVPNTIIRHDAVVSATGSIEYLVAELLDLSSKLISKCF